MKIAIINGPNLNLLGSREPEVYGNTDFESYLTGLRNHFPDIRFTYFQSNVEGELINALQQHSSANGIVLNAGAYTHTSVAIADAIASINAPVVEVHISNIFSREPFRHTSYSGAKCIGSISGLGLDGYRLAIDHLLNRK